MSKNAEGFLAKFIREKWQPPSGYIRKADRERVEADRKVNAMEQSIKAARAVDKARADKERAREKRAELEQLWASVGKSRRLKLEDEAMKNCPNEVLVDGFT